MTTGEREAGRRSVEHELEPVALIGEDLQAAALLLHDFHDAVDDGSEMNHDDPPAGIGHGPRAHGPMMPNPDAVRQNRAMRVALLGLVALCLAGCGAEVTNTVMQPVSMCTTYLRGHTVRVTIDGLQADTLCHEYSRNRAIVGERWSLSPPASSPRSLPTICRLSSASGETEVIVADHRSTPQGPMVCREWRSSGWVPVSRDEGP